jgi:AcrR family transcriptional regulator
MQRPHPDARARPGRDHVRAAQRARIISAGVTVACEHGVHAASVARISALARVSPATFRRVFADRDECLLAALEDAVALTQARVQAAYDGHARWVDAVRAGLFALLCLFDEEPRLARVCVLHAPAAGPAAFASRGEVLDALARILQRGRVPASTPRPTALTAQALVGGTLAIVHNRLLRSEERPLADMLPALMGMIVLPYLGPASARRELARPLPSRAASPPEPAWPHDPSYNAIADLGLHDLRLTYRTLRVLAVVAERPGLGNNEVGERAGVSDAGQTSKLLARLARLELLENTAAAGHVGAPKAWRLTAAGATLERAFRP